MENLQFMFETHDPWGQKWTFTSKMYMLEKAFIGYTFSLKEFTFNLRDKAIYYKDLNENGQRKHVLTAFENL